MSPKHYLIPILLFAACKSAPENKAEEKGQYSETSSTIQKGDTLFAVSRTEFLEYGENIAFINQEGDTIIPFGSYAYFGTDTLVYYANVLEHPNDSTFGKPVGINAEGQVLFDLYLFDNGPDYFSEGLVRVQQNGKIGYANQLGEIVIPCKYAYAGPFEGGQASVTYEGQEYKDGDDHTRVESDSWFKIDKTGKKVE
ncbi:WG repeat-containing protein [Fulvivirga ligni]|uniref:WG repeat-containing protein n=1 Tax=Fulvivirga ligni TaxID=2904246 RepID=UPI001F441585|nr:WG repeat-containing protein [Fulvivirga ligni]UII19162.1 WG repeat-containing protein [Fulvivirga ligni]